MRRPFGPGQTLEQHEVHERIGVTTFCCDSGGSSAKTSKASPGGRKAREEFPNRCGDSVRTAKTLKDPRTA